MIAEENCARIIDSSLTKPSKKPSSWLSYLQRRKKHKNLLQLNRLAYFIKSLATVEWSFIKLNYELQICIDEDFSDRSNVLPLLPFVVYSRFFASVLPCLRIAIDAVQISML